MQKHQAPGGCIIQEKLAWLVEQAVLNILRQKPFFDFSVDHIEETLDERKMSQWLSLPRNYSFQSRSLIAAIKRGGKIYQTFSTEVRYNGPDRSCSFVFDIRLKERFEWHEAAADKLYTACYQSYGYWFLSGSSTRD